VGTVLPRWAFLAVLAAAALTYALPFRQPDCNTTSHYALVQMLASGTRSIDSIHGQSCDISWSGGHFYSNKAPGLALVSVPWYALLRGFDALRPNRLARASFPAAMRAIPRRNLWLLGLWGAVLPALGSLILVRRLAERIEPGSGVLAAATLGFATILLPFASLYFSHALAAFLALAAFALTTRLKRTFLAGAIAGFGVVVEYPFAMLAAVLAVYVVVRAGARSAAWFAAGAALGIAPLFIFNAWAYGSPFHLSYLGAVLVPGITGHDVLGANSSGFFGVGLPRPGGALHVLAGRRGLLSVAPVLLLVPYGLRLMWRRGDVAESALISAILAVFLIYNFGYYSPLGGATPGPRLLVSILGIAVVGLAPVFRTAPLTWCALLLASSVSLLAAHLTQPLISGPFDTGDWWEWLRGPHFTATILDPTGHGWVAAAPVALAALIGIAVASATVGRTQRRDAAAALTGLVVWVLCLLAAPSGLRSYAAAAGSVAALATLTGGFGFGRRAGQLALGRAAGLVAALSPLTRALWLVVVGLLIDFAVRL
jgi:hypothetical protein